MSEKEEEFKRISELFHKNLITESEVIKLVKKRRIPNKLLTGMLGHYEHRDTAFVALKKTRGGEITEKMLDIVRGADIPNLELLRKIFKKRKDRKGVLEDYIAGKGGSF